MNRVLARIAPPPATMPRRLLLLVTDLQRGGTPTVVRELATRLRTPDQHVEVACLAPPGPVAAEIGAAGIAVTSFGATRPTQLPAVVRRLRRLVRDRQIDTVFSFLVHANATAALASRRLRGVRFLQAIQTVQYRPRWHWWVQRWASRYAEKVVCPSSAVAEVARTRCRVPDGKVVVIPNAVDPDDYPRVEVFTGPTVRVGFLGRLDPVKHVNLFVDNMGWTDPGYTGHIFGDGPERGKIERQIARSADFDPLFDVRHRVFLRGPVDRPQEALSQMDVMMFPSLGEGFGLVLIEAMASGVPVVAWNVGGVSDVIEDEVNGFAVEFGSAQHPYRDLAPRVREIANDPALRQRFIDNGLRTVREKFSWPVVLPRYRELIGPGGSIRADTEPRP